MTERLDHSNYEAWLLDRLEGNLSVAQERQLDAFLAKHPELAPEGSPLPIVHEQAGGLTRTDKNALKRTIPPTGMPGEVPLDDLLIGRLEGDLSEEQEHALRAYLITHPEDRRMERLYPLTKVVSQETAFAAKEELHRHLPPVGMPILFTLDDFLVARLEGDLSADQEAALSALIAARPEAARAWAVMQQTRVVFDPVRYANKEALKKGGRVIAIGTAARPWFVGLAVAASITILLGISFWFLQGPRTDEQQIANVVPSKVVTEPVNVVPEHEHRSALGDEGTPDLAPEQRRDTIMEPRKVRERDQQRPQQDHNVPTHRIDREAPLPLAQQRPVTYERPVVGPAPLDALVADVPVSVEPLTDATSPVATNGATNHSTTVAGLVASTFRGKVLDQSDPDDRPLDGTDAVAMVDKGLKALGGERAGLRVGGKNGSPRGFSLHLGRNLSITAGR